METFKMICDIGVTFVSPKADIFTVKSGDTGKVLEAPVWIKDTTLYQSMLQDGKIHETWDEAQFKAEQVLPATTDLNDEAIIVGTVEAVKSPVKAETEPVTEPPKKTSGRKKKDDAE